MWASTHSRAAMRCTEAQRHIKGLLSIVEAFLTTVISNAHLGVCNNLCAIVRGWEGPFCEHWFSIRSPFRQQSGRHEGGGRDLTRTAAAWRAGLSIRMLLEDAYSATLGLSLWLRRCCLSWRGDADLLCWSGHFRFHDSPDGFSVFSKLLPRGEALKARRRYLPPPSPPPFDPPSLLQRLPLHSPPPSPASSVRAAWDKFMENNSFFCCFGHHSNHSDS